MPGPRIVVDPIRWVEVEVPAFATPDEAIERHRRFTDGLIPIADLFPEDGTTTLLWGLDGGPHDVGDFVEGPIVAEFAAWHARWEAGFHYADGWADKAEGLLWQQEGDRLWKRLSDILWFQMEIVRKYGRIPSE